MAEHDRGQRVAEDYVCAIATLQSAGQSAIGARLAKLFGVSPPTVTETLHRLVGLGLVQLNTDKSITLTPTGRELARRTLRRRRIAERFFVDALGMRPAEARDEADRLEHALSDNATDRLIRALGNPEDSPDGDPIDEANGAPEFVSTTLDRAPIGIPLVIERIESVPGTDQPSADHEADLLERGLLPGGRVVVTGADGGAVTVRGATGEVTLQTPVARRILVRQAGASHVGFDKDRGQPRFRLEVLAVQGNCVAGYQSGDRFEFGHCTPAGLCLEALQRLYPAISALRLGGASARPIQVPCPDDGIVTFTLESSTADE